MALRISTALRNFLNSGGSFKQAFTGGRMEVYTGTQPTDANTAATGTLLLTVTDASGAWTAETQATGAIQITGGAAGSIDTVTVGGYNILDAAVSYVTSINATATALAAALNKSAYNLDFEATASTDTVTLTAKPGLRTKYNTVAVSGTTTTLTVSYTNFSGGVASANGLNWEDSASGSMSKRSGQNWTGVCVATGTAGWFRLYGPITDASADDVATYLRMDGSIATSGAQWNITPTSFSSGSTQTVGTFAVNVNAV